MVQLDGNFRLFDEHRYEMLVFGVPGGNHFQRQESLIPAPSHHFGEHDFGHAACRDLLDQAVGAQFPRKYHSSQTSCNYLILGSFATRVKGWLALAVFLGCFFLSQRALAETSGPYTALLQGARAAAAGQWTASRALLEAVPLKGRPAPVWAGLGLTWLAHHRPGKARPLLEKAIQAQAAGAASFYWQAVVAARLNRPAAAIEALEVAVSLAPEKAEYRLARGLALAAVGRRSEATADVVDAASRQANLLSPRYHPDLLLGLFELVDHGLRTFPQAAMVEETMALLLLDAGYGQEALARVGHDSLALRREILGRRALRQGESGRALALLTQAEAQRSTSPRLLYHLARAAYQAGERERAREVLVRAAQLDPADGRIQALLGTLWLEQGDLERAELAFGYALHQGRHVPALVGLGRAHELQGQSSRAISEYREALSRAPGAAEPLERLTRLLDRGDRAARREAAQLRRRLAAANRFERDFGALVQRRKQAHEAHEGWCQQVRSEPRAALARIPQGPAAWEPARRFGHVAAWAAEGHPTKAGQVARRFLARYDLSRWAGGASRWLVMGRRIGPAEVIRTALLDYVIIE
jgi:tetratricopeptide (TPR) repeat protein